MATLAWELTCSSYTISPLSYNKINVENTLDNITWMTYNATVYKGSIVIDNKLYTLVNGHPGYIDLNTFETKIIDNTNMVPDNVNFIYNPYKRKLNLFIDRQSGTQYDIDNNKRLNDLNITNNLLSSINVYNSNHQYQIMEDENNNYNLYDMYELTQLYYFDSSKFKILYSFMLNNNIYILLMVKKII